MHLPRARDPKHAVARSALPSHGYEQVDADTPREAEPLRDTRLEGDSTELYLPDARHDEQDAGSEELTGAMNPSAHQQQLHVLGVKSGKSAEPDIESGTESSTSSMNRNTSSFHGSTATPWMQIAVCALSAISGFLFGYDLCVMVVALPLIQRSFELSTTEAEAVVSVLMVGAFFGSLGGGIVADRIGRKRAIIWTGLLFLLGSLCMTFAHSLGAMLLGRFLAGLAVGSSGPCVSTYIAEIARPENRGALVTINEVMVCVGCLVSVLVSSALKPTTNGWRKMLAVTLVPPVFQLLGMPFMPESPRWLLAQEDRQEEAKTVLRQLFPHSDANGDSDDAGDGDMQLVRKHFNHDMWDVVHEIRINPSTRRRLMLSLMVALAHTMTGANAMLYFSTYILQALESDTPGDGGAASVVISKEVGVAIAKVAGVCTAIAVVDKVGRRPLIIIGSLGMLLSDFAFAILFWRINVATENTTGGHGYELFGVWTLYVFIYAWNLSWAPLMWVICSELLPDDVRSIGMGLTFATYWLGSSVVNQTLLTVFEVFGMCTTFLVYTVLTTMSLVFMYVKVPETNGLSFEEITALFH